MFFRKVLIFSMATGISLSIIAQDNTDQSIPISKGNKLQIQTSANSARQTLPQPGFVSISDMMDMMTARQSRLMDQVMNDMFYLPQSTRALTSYSYPQSKFITKDDRYLFQLIVPGIEKKDISIQSAGRNLTISYKDSKESDKTDGSSSAYEKYTNEFQQYIVIPTDADIDNISSSYKDGILAINIPRIKTAQVQTKTIHID